MITSALVVGYLASVCFAIYATRRYYKFHRDEDPSIGDVFAVLTPLFNISYAVAYITLSPIEPSDVWRKLFRIK